MSITCKKNGIVPVLARTAAAVTMLFVGTANSWAIMSPIVPIKVSDDKLSASSYRILVRNEKIEFAQGTGNQVAHFSDGTNPIMEDCAGRISMGTVSGAGFTSEDDNLALHGMHSWPAGNASYIDVGTGTTAADMTWTMYGGDGAWSTSPFLDQTKRLMTSSWTVDGVLVTQSVELIGSWAKISWKLTNNNTEGRYVNMRMTLSQMLNLMNIPYVAIPGYGVVKSDTTISGANMPSELSILPSQQAVAPELKILFKGNNLAEPSLIQVGDHSLPGGGRLGDGMDPNGAVPSHPIGWLGARVTFKPTTVAAGASVTMSTMIGLGSSSLNAPSGSKFSAETECRRSVSLNSSIAGYYDPSTMDIYGYTTNLHDETQNRSLSNVKMTISLPKGLKLVSGQSLAQTIDTVERAETKGVSWKVQPDGTAYGDLEYSVTVTWDQVTHIVTRKVFVPMIPQTDVSSVYQLKSFGYSFSNPSPATVLGVADGSALSETYDMFGWDNSAQKYVAGDGLTEISPATGYWLRVRNSEDAGIKPLYGAIESGDPFGTSPYRVNLPAVMKGWTLIGNPYPYSVAVGNLKIFDRSTQNTLTIADAVTQGKVRGTIFRWQPKSGSYNGGYQSVSIVAQPGELMKPGDGYWMYISGKYLGLEYYGSSVTGATQTLTTPKSASNGWRVTVGGSVAGIAGGEVAVGGSASASDTEDGLDTPVPPASPETAIQMSLGGGLSEDIRTLTGRKVWDLTVSAPQGTDSVNLQWNGMKSVPSNVRLTLVDSSTGRSRDMRGNSSYVVDMSGKTTKTLKVVAEPAGSSALRISSVRVGRTRAGSVQLSYNLSDNATCSVRVMGANGSEVTTLAAAGSNTRGVNTITWNGHDAQGVNVPAGAYLMEITASTEDGQTAKTVQPVIMTR